MNLLPGMVTKTPPMKICSMNLENTFNCLHNVAAMNVYVGNGTLTERSSQQIVSKHKIPTKQVMVS